MRNMVLIMFSCLLSILLGLPSLIYSDEVEQVLYDDFSDGNFHTNPSWEPGDLNWYNPFFIESFQGHNWAGAKQFGSFGTWFYTSKNKKWPVPISTSENPITISFLACFRPKITNDTLNFSLIGPESLLSLGVTAEGKLKILFQKYTKENKLESAYQKAFAIPKIAKGVPVKLTFIFGRKNCFQFKINNNVIYKLPIREHKKVLPFFTSFDRLAFAGPYKVKAPNVHLLVPAFQDTRAFHWITNIEVLASVANLNDSEPLTLSAKSKSCLIFRGLSAFNCDLTGELTKSGWDIKEIYVNHPLRGRALVDFRKYIQANKLAKYEWVVLCDISARTIGLKGCYTLRNYIASGGKVLITGGANTMGRGLYFSSPLADYLPITGKDSPDTLFAMAGNKHTQFSFTPKIPDDSHKICGYIPILQKEIGQKGIVRIIPWALFGHSPKFFSGDIHWLKEALSYQTNKNNN